MKIAVFSGAVPSSTFIEHLIGGVAKHHDVLLFGVIEKKTKYTSKTITIYKTPYSHWQNLVYTLYRLLLLFMKSPKLAVQLFKEIKPYPKLYDKWIWFSKFLPIVLYEPDVFHMQWTRDLEFYTFLKTRFGIPMVVSLRGAHVNYTPIVEPRIAEIYRSSFPKMDFFHAVSKDISLKAQLYGANPLNIKVIHSPIPHFFFNQYSSFKKSSSDCINIVSVGRFHWIKGFKYAIDAISKLYQKGIKVHYTIVGPSEFTEDILFQLHDLGIKALVSLKSSMQQQELATFLKTQDVLLLSSLEEGIANVVLESMAVGLPVISTDCGGMREVVLPKETGWLVPVRNPKAIADAIVEVSQASENDLQRITQNAHDFVETHFNTEDSINQFLELYNEVAGN